MKSGKGILLAFALSAATAFGQGTILWNEAVNGPLSFDPHNPTLLGALALGSNTVSGATELEPTGPGYFVHEDYFTFVVPVGATVTAAFLSIDRPSVGTWIGDSEFNAQLSYNGGPLSGPLLPQWGLSALVPGSYGMYLANLDTQPFISIANYRLDFVVEAIPEPASLWLLLGGLGWLGIRVYSRRTSHPKS